MHRLSPFLALLSCMLLATAARAETITAAPPIGPVVGTLGTAMHAFLGIPYAEPPVGALRWAPPEPHAPWTTPRDATTFGGRCAQTGGAFGEASTNEDCLYLNVYVPHRRAAAARDLRQKLPVMVWIHGGAFQNGSGENYDPTKLVTEGRVVVVTINYRLGALGFFAHPALSAESPAGISGNYGILDQQLALQWVQQNVAAFGGDPRKVTIFGESAGGISVHAQLASPLSAGTFHRAIVQSGAVFRQPTLDAAESAGTTLADAMGCPDQSAECLRALTVDDVLGGQPSGLQTTSPVIDGVVLPIPIRDALETGQFNRVPVMQGSNHDEMRLFVAAGFDLQGRPVTPATYDAAVAGLLGLPLGVVPIMTNHYPLANYASPDLAVAALATDVGFACNALASDEWLARYVPVYAYEFDDENAPQIFLPPVSFPYGAAHASELQYLFDLPAAFPQALDADQERLSDAMVGYWARFAKTGKPSARRAIRWPRFDPINDATPLLVSLTTPAPSTKGSLGFHLDHQCAFWNPLVGNN